MPASHFEFLVEEPSMEAFLRVWLLRVLPEGCTYEVHSFQGKSDILGKLQARLHAYSRWLPDNWRIIVVVDRDMESCRELKRRLELTTEQAGLLSRSRAAGWPWQVVNRIAIEELEAWYFGDWTAVQHAFPRVSGTIPLNARYRDPDAISGGTWEAFERVLRQRRYFPGGLEKLNAARAIAEHIDVGRSTSASFRVFAAAIDEALS